MRRFAWLLVLVLLLPVYISAQNDQEGNNGVSGALEPARVSTLETFVTPREGSTTLFVAWSPSGELLATFGTDFADEEERISLWNTATGERVASLANVPAEALAFSPDGALLGVVGVIGNVLVLDVATFREAGNLATEDAFARAVFEDDMMQRFGVVDRELLRNVIQGAAFSAESGALLVISRDPVALDVGTGVQGRGIALANETTTYELMPVNLPDRQGRLIPALTAYTSEGLRLGYHNGDVTVSTLSVDVNPGANTIRFEPGDVVFAGQAFDVVRGLSQDGDVLLVRRDRDDVAVLRVSGESVPMQLPEGRLVFDTALSPDGRYAAGHVSPAESDADSVLVWDTETGSPAVEIDAPSRTPPTVHFSPSGDRLAIVTSEGITVWSLTG